METLLELLSAAPTSALGLGLMLGLVAALFQLLLRLTVRSLSEFFDAGD